MNELFTRIWGPFQDASTVSLVGGGVVATAVGLFLWLGGARFQGLVVGLLGAAMGATAGAAVSQWLGVSATLSVAIGAVVLATLAVLAQQLIIILLAVVIFATVCGGGYLGSLLQEGQKPYENMIPYKGMSQGSGEGLTNDETDGVVDRDVLEPARANLAKYAGKGRGLWERFKQEIRDMGPSVSPNKGKLLLWCLAGAVVGLILAQLLKWIVMALCCSVVGTTGIVMGVTLLMMAKGNQVAEQMANKPRFLPILFLAMVIFGWTVQLLTGRPKTRKSKRSRRREG